jgi:MYXO-CTERM domain-containing protein
VIVDAGVDAADAGDETGKKGGCGCRVGDARTTRSGVWLSLLAGLSVLGWQRRRARD